MNCFIGVEENGILSGGKMAVSDSIVYSGFQGAYFI